jgi:hypothetical protein
LPNYESDIRGSPPPQTDCEHEPTTRTRADAIVELCAVVQYLQAAAARSLRRAHVTVGRYSKVMRLTEALPPWMLGQATSLAGGMHGFGWSPPRGNIVGNVCGSCWQYPLLVVARQ